MRRGPEVSGWPGSLFPEPITQAKPRLLDDNSKVLALLRNERGELYCNCYGMIVKERKCHKCVGYVSESDTCRWVMSVHDAELVNGKPQWVEAEPAPAVTPAVEPTKVNNPSGTPVPEYCNLAAKECTHCKWESYWTGDGKWPCPNLGRDNGPRKRVPPLFAAKSAKTKKSKCLGTPDESIACKECALNKFWKWRPCALPTVEAPAVTPAKEPSALLLNGKWYSEGKEITEAEANAPVPQSCSGCLCLTCTNKAMCHHCKDTAICAKYNARTVTCPAFADADHSDGWTCSDCLCPKCANSKENCQDCKGPVFCSKHGGKIGNCPDFRTEEGKEQHCLENGCLCFKCQLIGEQCEQCVGPIRCDKPTMKCKEYVGAEVKS